MMKVMFLSGPLYMSVLTVNPEKRDPSDVVKDPSCSHQSRTVVTTKVVGQVRHEQEVFYLATLQLPDYTESVVDE